MILWQDFVLDDVCGPLLNDEAINVSTISMQVSRRKRFGSPSVMEDANGKIQETRQVHRPARMVGPTSLDFNCQPDMEVGLGNRIESSRRRGEA